MILHFRSLPSRRDISPMVTLLCSGLADHATGATIDINAGSIRSLNTYGKIRISDNEP